MQKIVIVGAGPAGLLLAHYLLARGDSQVEIYESRPDPRSTAPSQQRTFPLSLQVRGLNAIRGVPGLEAAVAEVGIWGQGALVHRQKGKPQTFKRKNPQLLIDRNRLTLALLQHLLGHDGHEALSIRFNCPCVEVNPDNQTITLQPLNGDKCITHFDRLVGADGARSQVREALVARNQMQCQQALVKERYKSLAVPRISQDKSVEAAADFIHQWNLGRGMPVIMVPQPGDQLNGVVIFPPDKNPLQSLSSDAAVLAYFQERCPTLGRLMTLEIAADLRRRPVSKLLTVKCDRLHVGNRILLIGDAVHAVTPSISQGCNASLQDAQVVAQLIDRYQDDWDQALPTFTAERLPDVHALRDLSDYCFPLDRRMIPEFIFRVTVSRTLSRWFPKVFTPFALDLLLDGDLPYSEVLRKTHGWIDRVKRSARPNIII